MYRINVWINIGINEWINVGINEWINVRINEWINVGINEWINVPKVSIKRVCKYVGIKIGNSKGIKKIYSITLNTVPFTVKLICAFPQKVFWWACNISIYIKLRF